MAGRFLLACACFALIACGGADPETEGDDEVVQEEPGFSMPPGGNDSDYDDGSKWPRWKNPCPGPACDPPRHRGEEVSNPAPDGHAPSLSTQPER